MGLNKVKQGSNMYQFLNDNGNKGYTWNTVKGECPHQCSYCYCKRWGKQPELHFDEKELTTDLGSDNFIFVGSSCDMWAEGIPSKWIDETLYHCRNWRNKYLFQSKNPARFKDFTFPDCILGTTIETNREYDDVSNAPREWKRYDDFIQYALPKMVSIEPIMDFDLDILVDWMRDIKPEFVSIGADSKGHHLPEPVGSKVKELINALRGFTTVKTKKNLDRLFRG